MTSTSQLLIVNDINKIQDRYAFIFQRLSHKLIVLLKATKWKLQWNNTQCASWNAMHHILICGDIEIVQMYYEQYIVRRMACAHHTQMRICIAMWLWFTCIDMHVNKHYIILYQYKKPTQFGWLAIGSQPSYGFETFLCADMHCIQL